jgi:hypothetical protein
LAPNLAGSSLFFGNFLDSSLFPNDLLAAGFLPGPLGGDLSTLIVIVIFITMTIILVVIIIVIVIAIVIVTVFPLAVVILSIILGGPRAR